MEVQLVYQKLKQFFPHQLENIDISQMKLSSPSSVENLLGKKLPHLPLNQVHMLCRNQQKNVMNRVLEVKEKDLYEEMKQVCPNKDLKNIRSFSHEEMNAKIQHYTTRINAIQEKEMQSETDQPDSDMIDIEDEMEIEDLHHEIHHDQNRELRNIFEEYDHHLPWNDLGIYDLH